MRRASSKLENSIDNLFEGYSNPCFMAFPSMNRFFLFLLAFTLPCVLGARSLPEQLAFYGRWDRRQPERVITVNSGSSIKARFEGTGMIALFDTAVNQLPFPTIAWRIDGGSWQEAEIAPSVTLAEKLSPGPHDLFLMARGLDEHQSRWASPLIASITLTDLTPTAGRFIPLLVETGPKLEFLGDSITEGVLVHDEMLKETPWPWLTDGRLSYAGLTAMELHAQWRQVGFGGQGVTRGGSGGIPAASDTLNFFYKDCPRDDWQPDAVIINQGTNDRGVKPDFFKPIYAAYLKQIRTAYPKAKIIAIIPFCGAQSESIKAVIQERHQDQDTQSYVIDASQWLRHEDYTDGLHPNVRGGEKAAKQLAAELRVILAK